MKGLGLEDSAQISDEELIKGLKAGEKDSHRLFLNKYGPKLLAYIRATVGNYADADEILNDVFLTVIVNIDKYKPAKASLKTWVYTITRNRALGFYRKEAARREKEKDYCLKMQAQGELSPLANASSAEEADTPQIKALKGALNQLSGHDRTLLEIHYNGIPPKEIATLLGVKPGTIRVALHRARCRLKKKLATFP